MEFLKKFDLTGTQFFKLIGLILIGLVTLAIVVSLVGSTLGIGSSSYGSPTVMAPSMPLNYGSKNAYSTAELSARNVSDSYMPPEDGGYTTGDNSEAFEVKEYNARIETRDHDRDCAFVRNLKSREDVVFENTNEYNRGCTYTFKVKKGSVEDILSKIKELDPKELTESAYTIKREVDDYTSEVQILQNKLASLDATLAEAITSYSDITQLATRMGDVESLAKIIESKLTIIERLTNARIETSNQLERINRSKAEALDRLEYTYFSVSISENKFVDKEEIENSWKFAVQQFVRDMNGLLQEISIGLIALLFMVAKFALYFFLLLFVVKFGWTFAKKIWQSGSTPQV